MKNIKKVVVLATVALFTSCSISGPLLVTDNETGEKRGEASYIMWFGFPPKNGDASIRTAAKNGGITKVATVDQKISSGFLKRIITTTVTGS